MRGYRAGGCRANRHSGACGPGAEVRKLAGGRAGRGGGVWRSVEGDEPGHPGKYDRGGGEPHGDGSRGEPHPRPTEKRLRTVEDAEDPAGELGLAAPGTEREAEVAAQDAVLCDAREASGVGLPRSGGGEDAVVAGQFTFEAEPPFYPEEHRVEREEHERELLQQVCPVVGTGEMFRLVQQNLVELGGGEGLEQAGRKQDARLPEAQDAGAVDIGRGAERVAAARAGSL